MYYEIVNELDGGRHLFRHMVKMPSMTEPGFYRARTTMDAFERYCLHAPHGGNVRWFHCKRSSDLCREISFQEDWNRRYPDMVFPEPTGSDMSLPTVVHADAVSFLAAIGYRRGSRSKKNRFQGTCMPPAYEGAQPNHPELVELRKKFDT